MRDQSTTPPETTDGSSESTETGSSETYGQGDEVSVLLGDTGTHVKGSIVAETPSGLTIRQNREEEIWNATPEGDELTVVTETIERTIPWSSIQWVDMVISRTSDRHE
jgi:hypothetical protein